MVINFITNEVISLHQIWINFEVFSMVSDAPIPTDYMTQAFLEMLFLEGPSTTLSVRNGVKMYGFYFCEEPEVAGAKFRE